MDEETLPYLPSMTGILKSVSGALVLSVIITAITVNPDPDERRER
jgi:hypothetical protein